MRARLAALCLFSLWGATATAAPGPALPPSALAQLGRQVFFDPGLSASGQLACASCHSPAHAYSSPSGGTAPRGGRDLNRTAQRTVPSLRYLAHTPRFTRHLYVEHGEDRQDQGPTGGFMLDGRADSLHAQAMLPWLDPAEMANENLDSLAQRLRRAAYAPQFAQSFGQVVLDDPRQLAAAAALALERFEIEDASFDPYSSRYDRYLAGEASLSVQQQRGLALFVDPRKGNCAECHPNARGPGGRGPVFTDYAYRALGVPRNRALATDAAAGLYDLGLCGPKRRDLAGESHYCGYFKTPTLRNSARRTAFFHNGRFTTLRQVLEFYATRDTAPEHWYPRVHGRLRRFDDLPMIYFANVDTSDAPFGRAPGDAPVLTSDEIDDLAAFIGTLDDADQGPSG